MMKEKQGLFGEEGVIGLAGILIVEKLPGWWRLLGKKMCGRMEGEKSVVGGEEEAMGVARHGKSRWGVIHLVPLKVVEERGKDGQERLGKAMQTPLPDVPMTPGSVPPATPPPEIPSTPEPGVPATPYGKE